MYRRNFSEMILTLILVGIITLMFNTNQVKATETIYIRANGSIEPSTTPIQRLENVYTFTDNIYDSIVVERNNTVIDGAGYTLQGIGIPGDKGIDLSARENVTVRNMQIQGFGFGIWITFSYHCSIKGNRITNNTYAVFQVSSDYACIDGNTIANNTHGILLGYSYHNSISENNITANSGYGISKGGDVEPSSYNNVSRNTITYNGNGISLDSYNNVVGNKITNNGYGIVLGSYNNVSGNNIAANNNYGVVLGSCNSIIRNNVAMNHIGIEPGHNNTIYLNNFTHNTQQVVTEETDLGNFWDDGYYVGGNYWSNYTGVDDNHDGIGDTPHVINANNTDRYPLMRPWGESHLLGDVNFDDRVDMDDVYLAAKSFGMHSSNPKWNPRVDVSGDNRIDMLDIYIVCKNFGKRKT